MYCPYYQGAVSPAAALALLGVWLISLAMCVWGTKSLKWTLYVSVPLPYLMLLILFFRSALLLPAPNCLYLDAEAEL